MLGTVAVAAARGSRMDQEHLITSAARIVELAGVGVLLLGAMIGVGVFALRLARGQGMESAYHGLRSDIGRAILLGLEFLVIADIIGTIAVRPTFENLGVLALIVVIRTFLSFTLELEVSGHWPWQKAPPGGPPTHA